MSQKRVIVVFGATGNQGKSIVHSLVKDDNYSIRAVTRNPKAEKAKFLHGLDRVEVVKADVTDVESIRSVVTGAYGVFAITNFWDPSQMGKEVKIAENYANAIEGTSVEHVVFHTLPNVEALSEGKYDVPHFTDKAKGFDIIKKISSIKYATGYAPAFYYQNFGIFFNPVVDDDGTWNYYFPPIKAVTACDIRNTGKIVTNAFNNPNEWNQKVIITPGFHAPVQNFIDEIAKVTEKKVVLNEVPYDKYKTLFQGAKEMGEMFSWFNEFGYYGPHADLKNGGNGALAFGSPLSTFSEFAQEKWGQ